MNIKEIILKHKNGVYLSEQEINFVCNGFVDNVITKAEMTDFLNAVVQNDLSEQETFFLTKAMLNSGQIMNLSQFNNTIDKHSTGGVSDSTSLIVVPLFSLFGFTCIKMSGGGLGHTGGTADKLHVFEGLKNSISQKQAFEIAKKTNACFMTATNEIAPADKKIYALRDEINAMSVGLIASSIMSKKLACGAKNLILDVKFGNGALLNTKAQALKLARLMKKIGKTYGVNTTYILGDMNQPLGQYVGDKLEVFEIMEILTNAHMTRLLEHSLNIVATAISKKIHKSKKQIFDASYDLVKNGKVLNKLKEIVTSQGGKFDIFSKKPIENFVVKAQKSGIISKIQTKQLGFMDKKLKQTTKNYLGFKICVQLNQKVKKDDILFKCYFETDVKDEITNNFINTIGIKNEN